MVTRPAERGGMTDPVMPRLLHVTDLGRALIRRAGTSPERTWLRRLIRDPNAYLTAIEAAKLRRWLARQVWAQKTRTVELELLIGWTYDAERLSKPGRPRRGFITQRRGPRLLKS
jgi:hypothetical protein